MSVSVTLEATADHHLVLRHYAPGEECRPHRHDRAQISLVLAGDYVEDSDEGHRRVDGPGLSCKPGRFEHQNRFGAAGALILSLNLDAKRAPDRYFVGCGPEDLAGSALQRIAQGRAAIVTCTEDAAAGPPTMLASPAPWLTAARDRLRLEPGLTVGALARSLGLHPVRFARLFRAAHGESPTAARLNRRAAQAVDRLIRTRTSLAAIAAEEGFADQAHLTRLINRTTGWSPGRLRRLFAGT